MNRPKLKIECGEGVEMNAPCELNLLQIDFDFDWLIVCLSVYWLSFFVLVYHIRIECGVIFEKRPSH